MLKSVCSCGFCVDCAFAEDAAGVQGHCSRIGCAQAAVAGGTHYAPIVGDQRPVGGGLPHRRVFLTETVSVARAYFKLLRDDDQLPILESAPSLTTRQLAYPPTRVVLQKREDRRTGFSPSTIAGKQDIATLALVRAGVQP